MAWNSNQTPDLIQGNGVCDRRYHCRGSTRADNRMHPAGRAPEAAVTAGPDVITYPQALSGMVIALRNELGALLITTNEVQVLGNAARARLEQYHERLRPGSRRQSSSNGGDNIIDSLTLQGGRYAGIKVGGSLAGLY